MLPRILCLIALTSCTIQTGSHDSIAEQAKPFTHTIQVGFTVTASPRTEQQWKEICRTFEPFLVYTQKDQPEFDITVFTGILAQSLINAQHTYKKYAFPGLVKVDVTGTDMNTDEDKNEHSKDLLSHNIHVNFAIETSPQTETQWQEICSSFYTLMRIKNSGEQFDITVFNTMLAKALINAKDICKQYDLHGNNFANLYGDINIEALLKKIKIDQP